MYAFLQISKLGELLSLVPVASASKSRVVWRGLLAGSLLLLDRGCDVTSLAEHLNSLVTVACCAHASSRDPQYKRWVKWACIFIDITEFIVVRQHSVRAIGR